MTSCIILSTHACNSHQSYNLITWRSRFAFFKSFRFRCCSTNRSLWLSSDTFMSEHNMSWTFCRTGIRAPVCHDLDFINYGSPFCDSNFLLQLAGSSCSYHKNYEECFSRIKKKNHVSDSLDYLPYSIVLKSSNKKLIVEGWRLIIHKGALGIHFCFYIINFLLK